MYCNDRHQYVCIHEIRGTVVEKISTQLLLKQLRTCMPACGGYFAADKDDGAAVAVAHLLLLLSACSGQR